MSVYWLIDYNYPPAPQVQNLITPVFLLADFLVQGEDKYDYYQDVTCASVTFCDLLWPCPWD